MALDIGQLAKDMFNAAFPILKADAPEIENFAVGEFQKIAQQLATIELSLAKQEINTEQGQILVEMQKSASRVVLLTAKGLSLLTVEKALNAAIDAVKSAVNAAAGIAFL